MNLKTKYGCLYSEPYLNYGGFIHFPFAILQKIRIDEIIKCYQDQHMGALPMSWQSETFGIRVELSSHDDESVVNEFVAIIEEIYIKR